MGYIEQELRALEECMKEVIEKAPAIMEQLKRIAEVARSIRFAGEEEEAPLSDWAELARLARIRKVRVGVTTEEGTRIGYFIQVGSWDGDMYGIIRQYDDTSLRIYYKDITEMKFIPEEPSSQPMT